MTAEQRKDLFINWADRTHSGPKNITSTKKYASVLSRISSIIGQDIGCDFFDIETEEDFQSVRSRIESIDNYDSFNRSYQNGIISAALNLFEKFIKTDPFKEEEWFPSLNEYNPNITKEQWFSLLSDQSLFIPNALMVMAAFFAEGGQATCAQLATKYGKNASTFIMTSVHLAERIMKKTGCPKPPESTNSKFWPILFTGKNAIAEQQGAYIWKLRPELYEALEEFDILRFLPKTDIAGVFDSWEIIDETTAIKTCDKSFFDHNGSGVPKGICWFFDADLLQQGEKKQISIQYQGTTYPGLVRNESTDRLRTRVFWNADLGKKLNEFRDLAAVRAKFVRSASNEYELTMETEGAEKEMTVHEAIDGIKKYIAAKGFTYDEGLIENFYLSLKSKPFVILAGTSGTGKTKLVKLFAEAVGATAENGRYKLVPVRPDWSDSTDLFGHVDLNNRFHAGVILDFLKKAEAHPDKPYFLCLDEMNLARVEYYLSDFLSVIETREKTEDDHIVSVPLLSEENYGGDADAAEKYGTVRFPENLCLVGTVNMDETTFPFSKKVLDRANTIEFSQVDLVPDFELFEINAQSIDPGKLFLKPEYLQISHCKTQREYVHTVCEELQELNGILMAANAHVGYRVRDEICFYLLNNKNSELLPEETAMDYEIMQKILPRIQGSNNQIREMLCALFKFCAGDYSGYDTNSDYESMNKYLQSKGAKYRRSAEKIMSMVRRFDEDGFTSYWI